MNRFAIYVLTLFFSCAVVSAQDLVIVHTNDTHSQIDVQKAGEYAGLGGVERRYNLFRALEEEFGSDKVLFLDAGDYNQGSAYFTEYNGDVEVKVMNALGYDVVTLGNHEFDNGVSELARRLSSADYTTVCCNYDFRRTELRKLVKPYTIVEKGGKLIGIIGVTTDLGPVTDKGVVNDLRSLNTIKEVNRYARKLSRKCDLVILLSHRGYSEKGSCNMDVEMASRLKNVDIIVGGHTHTFLEKPTEVRDAEGERVVIVQDGWGGVNVGLMVIDHI